ncbi:MAG TPA: peptidoglycan binding domain-containing protein, partial [Nitrolancea sp.]|nr:peptidoglycan binding domain-containing protein [Nitrolancea sp.]
MVGNAAYGPRAERVTLGRSRAVSIAIWRTALILTVALGLIVAVAASLLLVYGWTHDDTIFNGVTAAGVDLGGLNRQQAIEKISAQIEREAPREITLTDGKQQWTVPASSIDLTFDANKTADESLQIGHAGSLWTRSNQWLRTFVSGEDVPVAFTFNEQAAVDAIRDVAPSVIYAPQDAKYVFSSGNELTIDPAKDGLAINVDNTLNQIRGHIGALSAAPVHIQTQTIEPEIQASDLQPGLKQADSMVSEPVILSNHGTKWEIPSDTLRKMLVVNGSGANNVTLSSSELEAYVRQIADQVKTPGQNATVRWNGNAGQFEVVKSTNGESLDAEATTANILAALKDGQHSVDVALTSTPAPVADADAQDAIARAQTYIAKPLTLTWDGGQQDLSPEQIASVLTFTPQPDQDNKIAIGVSTDAMAGLLGTLKDKVEVQAKDADLRYIDGAVTVRTPEQVGRTLDVDGSVKAIQTALTSGAGSAALVTSPVEPQITSAMAGSIVIREKLGSGQTYYGGSVSNRAYNVDLAVERANGALVPPGGTYSFVGSVGAIDLNNGYKVGYGIIATSNGSVSTVPSVGGGICQVATTLFHAAFWAGLPIVERSWHLYWIPTYGQAPSGITGLDATVDTDAGLDLKFKNTTNDWIAIQSSSDGTNVNFSIWGTDPGWDVKVDDPVV